MISLLMTMNLMEKEQARDDTILLLIVLVQRKFLKDMQKIDNQELATVARGLLATKKRKISEILG